MKHRVAFAALWAMLAAAPATAQNWIESFLDRYQAPELNLAVLETSESLPVSLAAMAQDGAIPLRISDVVRLVLENNFDIGVSRFTPLLSEYAIATAYQQFDPTLTLQANVGRTTRPAASQFDVGADSEANKTLNGSYSATYSHLLSPGTSYQVRFQMNRTSTNSPFATVNPAYNGTLTYQFTQPLLRDFGTRINTAPITIARNNLEISEVQFEQQVMDLVTQATNLYWDLVYAREEINVQEESLELAERTLADNRMQVEIGTLAPIEVVQAEQEVASRRESLVQARYSLTRIEDNLKTMVSRVPDPALVLLGLDPVEDIRNRTEQVVPVAEAIRLALENRPEMRQLDLQYRNDQLNVDVAKNALLPSLDITAGYTQSGIGGTEFVRSGEIGGQTVTVIPGGMGGAFSDIFGFDFTGYQVGFNLQIPLSNRSARANHARLEAQSRLTQSRQAATAQQIATEVRDAFNQIEMNRARIEAARESRRLAELRLDAEQQKFRLGASTIRFVLEEQRNLTQAQTTEIRSLVDHAKAVVAYDRAIGRTLELNNILIEEQLFFSVVSVGGQVVVQP